MTCMPVNGKCSSPLLPIFLMYATTRTMSVSRVVCNIDISSMIRHLLPRMFFFQRNSMRFKQLQILLGQLMPSLAHMCIVQPPTCVAAMAHGVHLAKADSCPW